jgi:hypothetical protein
VADGTPQERRIDIGRVVATPGALRAIATDGASVTELLRRHRAGDQGARMGMTAWEQERSLSGHYGPLSVFTTRSGERLLVITDTDAGTTTLLLAEEYAARTPANLQALDTAPWDDEG